MRWVSVILGFGFLLAACGSSGQSAVTEIAERSGAETVATDGSEAAGQDTGEAGAVDEANEDATEEVEASGDDVVAVPRRDPAAPFGDGAVYQPEATVFVVERGPMEAGTYRTGSLGTAVSFSTEESLMVQRNVEGLLVFTDVASSGPDDRDLVFARVEAFSDPTALSTPMGGQELWPADDFLGWLDRVDDAVVIASDPVEVTVNGMDAITVDIELAEGVECGFLPGGCIGFAVYDRFEAKSLSVGSQYRVWIVEQGDEAPLLIVAGIARDEDASWFPRADALLDTVAFGEVAPHPVKHLEFGSNELPALGGIDVNVPDALAELMEGPFGLSMYDRFTGRGFAFVLVPESPGVLFLSEGVYDLDGSRLTTADEVVQILTDAGSEITELDPITIDGAPTRVFSQSSENVWDIPFALSPLDIGVQGLGWDTPASSTIWLIDHPDRGLMLMSANLWEDDTATKRLTDLLGTTFAESMTFS